MQPKILLVDDREDNLLAIETIFEPDGYRFVKANSGRQALKILLREFDFALILMDVKMPNLNGFETASLIYERDKLKHIPIIFITANNFGDENLYRGYQAGAIDYIYKPIKPEVLRAKVSVLIDLYRKNRQLLAQEQRLVAKAMEDLVVVDVQAPAAPDAVLQAVPRVLAADVDAPKVEVAIAFRCVAGDVQLAQAEAAAEVAVFGELRRLDAPRVFAELEGVELAVEVGLQHLQDHRVDVELHRLPVRPRGVAEEDSHEEQRGAGLAESGGSPRGCHEAS